ncbi:MAG: hypothetical protein MMC33_010566 [Icmadophila ericetorum]|nr:hypothetical protein [Icmadophila ericetorum]
MDTFTLALCRYDRSLHLVISALADPIGVLSLQDARSVFFIRGNTFVEVSLPGLSTASEAASSLKAAVASCLDAHLAAHAIEPPYHRHPDSRLLQPAPVTVVAGKMFRLQMGDIGSLVSATTATSSNGLAVVPQGLADENGVLDFYALGRGEAEVTILVAHEDNLHPGHSKHLIRVVSAEGGEE